MLTLSLQVVNGLHQHYMKPADHYWLETYAVKWPTPATFGNTTLFATYRGFHIDSWYLERFCLNASLGLGTIIWPMYPMLYANNFKSVVNAIKQNGLYVTDIWAFVPGDGSEWRNNVWQQFYPPSDNLAYLESTLGDWWLGMDIHVSEQDVHYIGSYANQQIPLAGNRKQQFLNFRRHFGKMEDILGPKLISLISLTYPHYMGLYTMLGAETGQALPNAQIFYAFIRGACKQYRVLWFGNVSVCNCFGYKTYPSYGTKLTSQGSDTKPRNYTCKGQGEPKCGTSLNLMKRLMFAQILYGSSYVSFENSWFYGNSDNLSPIGKMQKL